MSEKCSSKFHTYYYYCCAVHKHTHTCTLLHMCKIFLLFIFSLRGSGLRTRAFNFYRVRARSLILELNFMYDMQVIIDLWTVYYICAHFQAFSPFFGIFYNH
jgi:hypothetical protein